MENQKASSKIHPLVAGAAIALILFSLVGVAAMAGLLPSSNSNTAPVALLTSSVPTPPGKIAMLAPTTEPKLFAADKASSSAQDQHKPVYTPAYRPEQSHSENADAPPVQAAVCGNCGTIESIRTIQQETQPNGIGAVAGAVLGGILGNQVGAGDGRKLATVAGAVGGGLAGNEIEKRSSTTASYEIRVRMEDGSTRNVTDSGQSDWRNGDRVRVVNGSLTAQG